MKERVWEIDFIRGLALCLMVIFHIVWNLHNLYDYQVNYQEGFFFFVGKAALFLFITISAVSCFFSSSNKKRAVKIFLAAFLVSAATYIFDSSNYIIFGVLHFLGVNVLLYYFYEKLNVILLVLMGTIIIALGPFISEINLTLNILVPLGIPGTNFSSFDYVPLIPYSGIFVYGVALAKILYPQKKSLFKKQIKPNPISFIGRRTLVIYLGHQPLIIVFMTVLNYLGII